MFKRRRGEVPTIIGVGAVVEGTLRVSGAVHIDGKIDGDVEAQGEVSVGPDGVVNGTVSGEAIAIAGLVEGKVRATAELHMMSTGRLIGDARYETLQVDRGGVIDGHTERAGGSRGLAHEEVDRPVAHLSEAPVDATA